MMVIMRRGNGAKRQGAKKRPARMSTRTRHKVAEHVAELALQAYCDPIRNAVDAETMQRLQRELRPHCSSDAHAAKIADEIKALVDGQIREDRPRRLREANEVRAWMNELRALLATHWD